MAYIGKSPTGTGVRQRYYFTATGGETSLSGADDNGLTLSFSDGVYVDVSLNGISLVAGDDYNTSTANTIGGLTALAANDVVEIVVYDIFTVADTVSAKDGGTFSGNVSVAGNDLILDADGDSKIEASTDDTINIISGGTTGLTMDSSGRITQPKRPFIQAIHDTDKNTYAINTVVGSGGELTIKESRGITESNGVFTLPLAGLYMIQLSLISTDTGSGLWWRKNSTKQWRIAYFSDADSSWSQSGTPILTECSANDTIDFLTEGTPRIYGNTTNLATGGISILFLG